MTSDEYTVQLTKKYRNYYRVRLSNGYEYNLPEEVVYQYNLFPGHGISMDKMEEALRKGKWIQCFQYGLSLLNRRAYFSHELRSRLIRKFPEVDIDSVIKRYQELRLLDDKRLIEEYIREKKLQGYGPRWIRFHLYRKKIPRSWIDDVFENYCGEEDEKLTITEKIGKFAKNYWDKHKKDPLFKRKRKLFQFLLSRGFDRQTCWECVHQILNNLVDDQHNDGGKK